MRFSVHTGGDPVATRGAKTGSGPKALFPISNNFQ
jgi:hypothetical protein